MPKAKLTIPYFCIIIKTTQESLWRYLAQDVAYETGNNIWVVENVSLNGFSNGQSQRIKGRGLRVEMVPVRV